jgi:hypothetical protein
LEQLKSVLEMWVFIKAAVSSSGKKHIHTHTSFYTTPCCNFLTLKIHSCH